MKNSCSGAADFQSYGVKMFVRLKLILRHLSFRDFQRFVRSLIRNRHMLRDMVRNDFQSQYLGSFLGIVWAFVQPLVFILVMWFVFTMGFRGGKSVEPVPFVLWLMTGMYCWFFFSESVSSGAGAIIQSSFLVKKIKFQLNILPLVKILSGLRVHVISLLFVMVLFMFNGHWPTLYWLQILYYLGAGIALLMGLSWITASVNVFVKDLTQIIQVLVRIGFWFTPIFWKVEILPKNIQPIIKLNPAFYLVQGYRDSIVYNIGFWQRPVLTLYYWALTFVVFVAGALIFKRLQPHFSDVL